MFEIKKYATTYNWWEQTKTSHRLFKMRYGRMIIQRNSGKDEVIKIIIQGIQL